ncbi:MAG: hypothetical protein LBC20_04800 [Planctomycetaceae bacterium]|nr:hypothetical protein [Planctomycetaceae bacterium]
MDLLFFDFHSSGTPKVVNISPKRFKQYGDSRLYFVYGRKSETQKPLNFYKFCANGQGLQRFY